MHETRAEAPASDAPIQTVFSALVENQLRTDQICGDIHDALVAGRTCLVLTQRTDHIDAIVARSRSSVTQRLCCEVDSARRPAQPFQRQS